MNLNAYILSLVVYYVPVHILGRITLRQIGAIDPTAVSKITTEWNKEMLRSWNVMLIIFDSHLPRVDYPFQIKLNVVFLRIFWFGFPFVAIALFFAWPK